MSVLMTLSKISLSLSHLPQALQSQSFPTAWMHLGIGYGQINLKLNPGKKEVMVVS